MEDKKTVDIGNSNNDIQTNNEILPFSKNFFLETINKSIKIIRSINSKFKVKSRYVEDKEKKNLTENNFKTNNMNLIDNRNETNIQISDVYKSNKSNNYETMKNSAILDQDFEISKQRNKSLENNKNYEIPGKLEHRLKILTNNKVFRAISSNQNRYIINEHDLNLSNIYNQPSYMLTNQRFYKLDALGIKKNISRQKLFVEYKFKLKDLKQVQCLKYQ